MHILFVFTVAIQTTTMVICSCTFTDFKLKYVVHVDCQLKLSQQPQVQAPEGSTDAVSTLDGASQGKLHEHYST